MERKDLIRKLLHQKTIRDQGELQEELARKGFRVTQSSVSRDLQDLNVIKIEGRYLLAEDLLKKTAVEKTVEKPAEKELLNAASWITQLTPAGDHLLVVQIPPGRASLLGVAIDQIRWPEVVGSIAGDDTIFIATRSRKDLLRLKVRLEKAKKGQINGRN